MERFRIWIGNQNVADLKAGYTESLTADTEKTSGGSQREKPDISEKGGVLVL